MKRNEVITADQTFFHSLRGILNKITPQNFHVLSERAMWLDITTLKQLTECIEVILEIVCLLDTIGCSISNLSEEMGFKKTESHHNLFTKSYTLHGPRICYLLVSFL